MDDINNIISFHKTATVIIQDSVNCVITGLTPTHFDFFINTYNLYAENYFFNPKVRLGIWDGKIPFFSKAGKTYVNLLPEIIPKIVKLGYKLVLKDNRPPVMYDVPDIDNTYFNHINNPKNGNPYVLESHQVDAANAVFSANGGIVIAATGFGKAQPLTAKVLTASGWSLMGDIKVGDKVITPKNTRVTVKGVFPQGETDVYRLTFRDGSSTEADSNHIWYCYNPNLHQKHTKPFVNFTTLELKTRYETLKSKAAFAQIPLIQKAIDFGDQNLPFDPYYFGILLIHLAINDNGEYRFTGFNPTINSVLEPFFNKYGVFLVQVKGKYEFDYESDTNPDTVFFFNTLRELIGNNITIPEEYKMASVKQRMRLFNGICDTHGMLDDNGRITLEYIWNTTIIKDLIDIVWMLGGNCTKCETNGYIKIDHPEPTTFFINTKKIETFVLHGKNIDDRILRRTIDTIEYIGKVETQCILIDDIDHLYITDDCIVTHNTILNAAVIDHYNQNHGIKTLTIVPSVSLINQTAEQFEVLELDVGRFDGTRKELNPTHIVSTWQTLKNYPHIVNQFQLVVVDECVHPNTKIDTLLGPCAIQYLSAGDLVLTYNETTHHQEYKQIKRVHKNMRISSKEKRLHIALDNGEFIIITGNHKILTKAGWKRADALTLDDELI